MTSSFGNLQQKNYYQSDYINKKIKNICLKNKCCSKKTNQLIIANKTNLVISQYSKLNLKDVCVISVGAPPTNPCNYLNSCNPCQNNSPVIIDPSSLTTPFYWNNTIDPLGELFGRSQCGELNYTKYNEF